MRLTWDKQNFRITLPRNMVKANGLQKDDVILLVADNQQTDILVVIPKKHYDNDEKVRQKIAEFVEEETI